MNDLWILLSSLRKNSLSIMLSASCSMLVAGCDAPGPYKNYIGIEYVHLAATQPGGPGALVTTVKACSPATDSGVHVGDIIKAIGTQSVHGENLDEKLQLLPQHSNITLRVIRAGKPVTLRMLLWRQSQAVYPSAAPYFGVGSTINSNGSVVVNCVYSGSPAERAGLALGDTIVSMNGEIVTAATFDRILTRFDPGTTIPVVVRRNAVDRTVNVQFTDDEPPDERLDVANLQILDGVVERVIEVEEVPLNNCAGNSTLESHRTFSKKVTRQMALNLNGELEAFGVAPFILAQAKLSAKYDFSSSDEVSESKTEIMRAEPRTFVTYVVTWYETSSKGLVELRANGVTHSVPFEVTRRLRVQTRAGSESPCT